MLDQVADTLLGFNNDLLNRVPVDALEFGSNGHVVRELPYESRLYMSAIAWENMPAKLFRWAVISRGILSNEQCIQYTGQSMAEHLEEMSHARKMEDPLDLKGATMLAPTSIQASLHGTRIGQRSFVWAMGTDQIGFEESPPQIGCHAHPACNRLREGNRRVHKQKQTLQARVDEAVKSVAEAEDNGRSKRLISARTRAVEAAKQKVEKVSESMKRTLIFNRLHGNEVRGPPLKNNERKLEDNGYAVPVFGKNSNNKFAVFYLDVLKFTVATIIEQPRRVCVIHVQRGSDSDPPGIAHPPADPCDGMSKLMSVLGPNYFDDAGSCDDGDDDEAIESASEESVGTVMAEPPGDGDAMDVDSGGEGVMSSLSESEENALLGGADDLGTTGQNITPEIDLWPGASLITGLRVQAHYHVKCYQMTYPGRPSKTFSWGEAHKHSYAGATEPDALSAGVEWLHSQHMLA